MQQSEIKILTNQHNNKKTNIKQYRNIISFEVLSFFFAQFIKNIPSVIARTFAIVQLKRKIQQIYKKVFLNLNILFPLI